jgi:hypothetical protein
MVSNANGRMRDALDSVGVGPHVDLVIDSHEEGRGETEPAHFRTRAGGNSERLMISITSRPGLREQ